ncbi:hypothetical protein LTR66_005353, partial [Elasticomyces elasticus]
MSGVLRSVKNVTKGYSTVQRKVRDATSNDAWGPTGTDMAEIAKITYNRPDTEAAFSVSGTPLRSSLSSSADFYEVMDMLDKRLNDKGRMWRHVLKSLKVLDYCLHEGSELCVTWARKNIYIIKTLREFQYIDEDGKDVGQNIRVSAKELTSLIMDEERLRAERANRHSWKSRVTGLEDMGPLDGFAGGEVPSRRHKERQPRPQREDENDLEYKLALEASKNEAEEDARRRAQRNTDDDDDDLAKAIRLSKEEEESRKRELEEQNAQNLFDDTPTQAPQPTGYNQGYQQQSAVDWMGNPLDQQQPQNTGYMNNMYSQPTGMQPQQTGFQNGYSGYGYQQPQQTGFDQNAYSQALQQQQQPQQTGYNPWASQINSFDQQQNLLQAGSNNPWAPTQNQQPDAVRPQPTGSNNPFASAINHQQTSHAQRAPTLSALQEQKTATQFNQSYAPNPITNF